MGVLFKFNFLWAEALKDISVQIFKAIAQSCCVIVYALSICMLGESVTKLKSSAVFICVAGVVVIAMSPQPGAQSKATGLIGITLAIAFTVGMAFFNVIWGKILNKADSSLVLVFLGLSQTTGIVSCLPMLFILDAVHIEHIVMP